MKKILTEALATVIIFLLFTLPSNAIKLEENNTYFGTIKDNNGNNIPLPPGEWLLTEKNIEKPTGRGLATFIGYTFYNSNVGYVYYFGPKSKSGSGDMWGGRKTPTMCEGNPLAGKTKIRGINNTEWCIFDDGEYIEFRNYTAQNFEQYYHAYYINKTLLKDKSKTTLATIGKSIFDKVRKNKGGDLSFLSENLDFNKSTSFNSGYNSEYTVKDISTYTDEMICLQATSYDGITWEEYPKKYYNEAVKRNLTISKCNKLTNRISDSEKNLKNTSKSENIESKLTELKSLLDKELITLDQYNAKSSEILEEF